MNHRFDRQRGPLHPKRSVSFRALSAEFQAKEDCDDGGVETAARARAASLGGMIHRRASRRLYLGAVLFVFFVRCGFLFSAAALAEGSAMYFTAFGTQIAFSHINTSSPKRSPDGGVMHPELQTKKITT